MMAFSNRLQWGGGKIHGFIKKHMHMQKAYYRPPKALFIKKISYKLEIKFYQTALFKMCTEKNLPRLT